MLCVIGSGKLTCRIKNNMYKNGAEMVLDYRYKLSQSHFILLMALGFKIHE